MDLSPLESRLGYRFQDPGLLNRALAHPSVGAINNQRLEFLGDAVLQLVISDWLYTMDRHLDEGQMTFLRAKLVRENTLADVARGLDLGSCLAFARSGDSDGMRSHTGVLADAMEAVLAAVYLDGGLAAASSLIRRLWDAEDALPENGEDSKSGLQKLVQSRGEPLPEYRTLLEEGPAHKRHFTVAVYLMGEELARGSGSTKKTAEQQAASAALAHLTGGDIA